MYDVIQYKYNNQHTQNTHNIPETQQQTSTTTTTKKPNVKSQIFCKMYKPHRLTEPPKPSRQPCHGFARTYAAMADRYGVRVRGDLCWDFDNIYAVKSLRSFNVAEVRFSLLLLLLLFVIYV
jgi:hypothetical protein